MHNSSPQPSTCGADGGVEGRPRRAQLDLRAVALAGELAESGGEDLGRGAGCRDVPGAARVERIDQPRPGDIREERVEADVGLERRLREADDAERGRPRPRARRDRRAARTGRCRARSRRRGGSGAHRRRARPRTGRASPGAGISVIAQLRRVARPHAALRVRPRTRAADASRSRARVQTRVSGGADDGGTPHRCPHGRRASRGGHG